MEQYLNSDASRTNIAMNLRMRKTIDFLKETVTIEEVTVEAKAEESPAEEASAEAPASQTT